MRRDGLLSPSVVAFASGGRTSISLPYIMEVSWTAVVATAKTSWKSEMRPSCSALVKRVPCLYMIFIFFFSDSRAAADTLYLAMRPLISGADEVGEWPRGPHPKVSPYCGRGRPHRRGPGVARSTAVYQFPYRYRRYRMRRLGRRGTYLHIP